MKIRYVGHPEDERSASRLNVSALNEVEMGDDSAYFHDLEVQLKDGTWVNLAAAFKSHTVVTDDYNTWFREAENDKERARGWFD